jgi:hypothetical protein
MMTAITSAAMAMVRVFTGPPPNLEGHESPAVVTGRPPVLPNFTGLTRTAD